MKQALTDLSQYYKKIADLAISYKKEADELREKYSALKGESEVLRTSLIEGKVLQEENQKLRDIITTSVYPEIANELLKAEGLLKLDHSIITDDFLTNSIVTADTRIDFSEGKEEKKSPDDSNLTKKVVSIKNLLDSKTNY